MGWASGSGLAKTIWDQVNAYIPEQHRQAVARKLVRAFERQDCDTMDEAEQLMKDAYPKGRRR